jgi:phosphohistidine phosphatase
MKLLLVRHAAAVPRGTPGVADDERPLTPEGEAKFTIAARGLARIAPRPDVLLTSPLPRARMTAGIAARAFEHIEPRIEPALAPGSVEEIVAALKTHAPGATVALVGHEPGLGVLLAHLLGASHGEQLAFKKGGAALVDLPGGSSAAGRLVWFLGPRILRTLAGEERGRRGAEARALIQ